MAPTYTECIMAPAWFVPSAQTSAIIGWVAGKATCQPSMLKWCGLGLQKLPPTDPTPPTPDTTEDTGEVPSELTPEQEQELLAGEESSQDTPRPPTPDDRTLLKATSFTPSNLWQWEYSSSACSSIMSRRPKSGDLLKDLAIALVKEDIPPKVSDDPVEPPAPKKPKSEGDGAPSM